MESPQVNARISPELNVEFDCWVSELGVTRGKLAWNIVTEALAARREGRATFSRPEQPSPVDLQHLTAGLRNMVTELERVFRQNGKRDAELAKSARTDTIGISEARTEIVAQLTAEFHRIYGANQVGLDKVAAELIAALTASPEFSGIAPALQRIERLPQLDAIDEKHRELVEAVKANNLAIARQGKKPAVHNSYILWDREWPGGIIAAALSVVWLVCIASTFAFVMILPRSWLAVPSANLLLGGGDQAVCALVDYRMATDTCRTEFGGKAMMVTVKARPGAPVHRR